VGGGAGGSRRRPPRRVHVGRRGWRGVRARLADALACAVRTRVPEARPPRLRSASRCSGRTVRSVRANGADLGVGRRRRVHVRGRGWRGFRARLADALACAVRTRVPEARPPRLRSASRAYARGERFGRPGRTGRLSALAAAARARPLGGGGGVSEGRLPHSAAGRAGVRRQLAGPCARPRTDVKLAIRGDAHDGR
jgi:hypothetical protein